MITSAKFLRTLWDYKFEIIGVVVLTALITIIYTLKAQVALKESRITRLVAANATLQEQTKEQAASLISLELGVETQNKAVSLMKEESAKLKASIAKANMQNKEKEKQIKHLLSTIYQAKPLPEDAKGKIDWLRQRAIENFARREGL